MTRSPRRRVQYLLRVSREFDATSLTRLLTFIAGLPVRETVDLTATLEKHATTFSLTASEAALIGLQAAAPSGISFGDPRPPFEDSSAHVQMVWRGRQGADLRTDDVEGGCHAVLAVFSQSELKTATLTMSLRAAMSSAPASYPAWSAATSPAKTGPQLRVHWVLRGEPTGALRRTAVQLAGVLRTRRLEHGQISLRRNRQLGWLWDFLTGEHDPAVTVDEMAGCMFLPLGGTDLPGVDLDVETRLRPAAHASRRRSGNRVFGVTTWPGAAKTLTQAPRAATRHTLITGPSGAGKSWLLTNLLLDDINAGRGVALIDMKGDTAADVTSRIASDRLEDVVLYEPAVGGPVPAMSSLSGSPQMAADVWIGIMRGQFPEAFGIRSQRYLRMAITTLASCDKTATIADLPRLFQNIGYRRGLLTRLKDPLLRGEWAAFESLSPAQQAEHIMPALGKISEVLARQSVRAMLAQQSPKMTLAKAVREGKVVIVSLPPGVIGQPAATMLGALATYEIWQAVMTRQSLSAIKRPYFGLYVDEPAVLNALPVPLDSVLETARGMHCGLTLATQSLHQLPEKVRWAALTNAATVVAFRSSLADSKLLAGELGDISSDQLQNLPPFTAALRLATPDGGVLSTTTVRTPELPNGSISAQLVRQRARYNFGQSPNDVDAEIARRLQGGDTEATPAAIGEIGEVS